MYYKLHRINIKSVNYNLISPSTDMFSLHCSLLVPSSSSSSMMMLLLLLLRILKPLLFSLLVIQLFHLMANSLSISCSFSLLFCVFHLWRLIVPYVYNCCWRERVRVRVHSTQLYEHEFAFLISCRTITFCSFGFFNGSSI